MKHAVTVLCILITLLQGGFSDAAWCICGIACAVILFFCWKRNLPAQFMVIMTAAVLVYAASALYHGVTYESLAAVMKLATACMLAIMFYNVEADVYETVFAAASVAAVIGCLTFCGIFHWDGAVASRRLQSVFEYANAAGVFFGIAAFITHHDEKRAPFAIVFETAMLLTQSIGAILVYLAGWAIFLLKNRESGFAPVFFNFAASVLAAVIMYAVVYVIAVPQLALAVPVALVVFRKLIRKGILLVSGYRALLWTGCGTAGAAVAGLFAMRGLRPVATYLERLIQIADGVKVMLRFPLGIGPGAWQFSFHAYQSAPYNASILHCGYAAAGVSAGIVAMAVIAAALIFWLKKQKWNAMSACIMMILMHAVLDITFSFLAIVFILAMLLPETMPGRETAAGAAQKEKKQFRAQRLKERENGHSRKPVQALLRVIPALPLVLCVVVLLSAAVKNAAAWGANSMGADAAEQLESRLVRADTEASLIQMEIYLATGEHGKFDAVFSGITGIPPAHSMLHTQALQSPNTPLRESAAALRCARAYELMAKSLLQRGMYHEAAEYAYICAEMSPYNRTGFSLLEEILAHLDTAGQGPYREKIAVLKAETKESALYAYIQRLIQ